jgi:hypothetical protein
LKRQEGLADRVVEDGENCSRAERIGLLTERMDLVGLVESGNGFEALPPRHIVLALRGTELEDKMVHDTSTGAPDAAEA